MGKKSNNTNQPAPPKETKAAEAVTVAWMLTLLCTAASLGLAVVLLLCSHFAAAPAGQADPFALLTSLLLFVSLVCSVLCLVLTWFTGRLRKMQPPRSITIFAIIAGVAPWVVFAIRFAVRS